MSGFVQAVALDLDGTIAQGPTLSGAAMDAVETARANGVTVILVTGRILDELHAEFGPLSARPTCPAGTR